MNNKFFELQSEVTVVLRRNSEYKETLIAGEDFFYVDSTSLPEMQVGNDEYWSIYSRKGTGSFVVVRMKNKVERKLSRVLKNVVNDRSVIVTFANDHFYDLRRENLLVCPVGHFETIQDQKHQALNTLEELPNEIKNVLVEKNRHSLPQEHDGSAKSLIIETEYMHNLTVKLHGIQFKATHLSE